MDSRLKSRILEQVLLNEDTQKALLPLHSQISNLRTGTKLSYRNAKNISEPWPSPHNIALRCLILNEYSCKTEWHLIQQQPLLSEIFQDPPIVSYKRDRSLKRYTRSSQTLSWPKHVDRSCVGLSPPLLSPSLDVLDSPFLLCEDGAGFKPTMGFPLPQ